MVLLLEHAVASFVDRVEKPTDDSPSWCLPSRLTPNRPLIGSLANIVPDHVRSVLEHPLAVVRFLSLLYL